MKWAGAIMGSYQPHLIAGFKTAKSIGMEPWLSPIDAFPTIENMFVNKGVLEKRLGFSSFAQMKHGAVAQTTTAIVGIRTFLKDGMPSLLIMDTARCNYYNPHTEVMTDVSSDLATPADIFNGSASDFFSFINWQGTGYMVNNVDQIHKWEGRGNAVVPFDVKINTDTKDNHVDTCRFMFIKDDRILLLETTEFGDWCPGRLRYSPVLQTDFSAAGSGYVDAPTSHRISAAGYVGKNIAVFFQGANDGALWLIKSTGNSDVPFKWERVTETELCRAPYSGVEMRDGLAVIGATNIIFYDGFKIKDMDIPNIRDVFDEFNDAYVRFVFGYLQDNTRHLLFTFADSSSSSIDRILDYNLMDNNWTIHKSEQSFFINYIGGFNGQKVPTMAELDDVYLSDGALVSQMTVDSRAVLGSPSPYTLIGCRNSRVYKWLDGAYDGTDDDSGKIEIKALSSRWNPYVKNGRKVACEKIGFFVDNDSTASFLVSVYKNTSSTAYTTKTISCDGSNDKFWAWIYCDGEIGDFHRIQISHTAKSNTPKIHAICPYFAQAGRADL